MAPASMRDFAWCLDGRGHVDDDRNRFYAETPHPFGIVYPRRDDDGSLPKAPRSRLNRATRRLSKITVKELQAHYTEVVGRDTRACDRRYPSGRFVRPRRAASDVGQSVDATRTMRPPK